MEVAVKEVRMGDEEDQEEQLASFTDFCHEVHIMSLFRHPQLLRLYGITLHPKVYL